MSLNTDTTMQVVPAYGNGGGMFGNNNDWWILLLFLFGWGGNRGWGGNGGGCGAQNACATAADVYGAVDQQTLISKLDQQTYGLADATYALNNAITGGFASAELSRCNGQAALMQQLNNMQHSADKCCCETQRSIDGVRYALSEQGAAIQHGACLNTRDLLENANANARAILDALTAQRIEDKNARIAEQQQTIFGLQLQASQAAQNAYLIGQLKQPCPIPAYTVPNPNCCYNPCGCGGAGYGFGAA